MKTFFGWNLNWLIFYCSACFFSTPQLYAQELSESQRVSYFDAEFVSFNGKTLVLKGFDGDKLEIPLASGAISFKGITGITFQFSLPSADCYFSKIGGLPESLKNIRENSALRVFVEKVDEKNSYRIIRVHYTKVRPTNDVPNPRPPALPIFRPPKEIR